MFIDSVVWIGAKLKRDQWHEKSVVIMHKLLSREINTAYVTDYIIAEVINFLLRKAGFKVALETLNLFKAHGRIVTVKIDGKMLERAFEIFVQYPGLSLTDASTVAAMERLGIKQLCSFDRSFDKIGWIERLES